MMVCAHVCVYVLSPLSLLLCYCVLYVNLFWCKTEWVFVSVCVCLPVCVGHKAGLQARGCQSNSISMGKQRCCR